MCTDRETETRDRDKISKKILIPATIASRKFVPIETVLEQGSVRAATLSTSVTLSAIAVPVHLLACVHARTYAARRV